MAGRNDKEKIRGHGNRYRAHNAQPFLHSEGPQHQEEAQEVTQKQRQHRIEEQGGEPPEETVHSPDDIGHGIARVLHRNLVAGHTSEHRVCPVGGSLSRFIVFLKLVGHALPLHGVPLLQNLALKGRHTINEGKRNENDCGHNVGAVFGEENLEFFHFQKNYSRIY